MRFTMNRQHTIHTHYDNLKVARDAPPEVIRAAYRSLCHKFHPDRHGGSAKATHTFQLIHCAYEVLNDPERRQQHDEWIVHEESAALRWDGRERRRRRWLSAVARRWAALGDGMNASLRFPWSARSHSGRYNKRVAAVLWTSMAAIGAIVFMLYSH